MGERFLAMHISGGTTELLLVEGERIERLGGDEDLHAGQFVDRVGVRMGCSFPAGPQLEGLAEGFSAKACWVPASEGSTAPFPDRRRPPNACWTRAKSPDRWPPRSMPA